MTADCSIKKIGSYLKLDESGYIVNTTSIDRVQEKWKEPLEKVCDAYKDHYSSNLHSAYVRGSVAKGEAIEGVSDIDTFAVVSLPSEAIDRSWVKDFKVNFSRVYPYIEDAEIQMYSLEDFENRKGLHILIKTQSICLYGTSLESSIHSFKPGRSTIQHAQHLEEEIEEAIVFLKERSQTREDVKTECAWIMKRILRTGFELVMERSGKYTRDLYPCYKGFASYYPDREREMYHVLKMAVCPTENKDEVVTLLENINTWISKEIKQFIL